MGSNPETAGLVLEAKAFCLMREWTTAHPKVDCVTKELLAFHSTSVKPYVRYSIVKPSKPTEPGSSTFDEAIPGVHSPKMMHDFGVSTHHTVIMDLPLTLDIKNQMHGMPSICFDSAKRSRFGVFPRYDPSAIRWYDTNPCLVFHTANCWDGGPASKDGPEESSVHLLTCRLTSASTVFRAGNLPMPKFKPVPPEYAEEEQCRLYYYNFPLSKDPAEPTHIRHQWGLSAIPFEFPTTSPKYEMREARYIYGCSTSESFTAALGKAAKIDFLAKIDAKTLIARGVANPPQPIKGCVDTRTIHEIVTVGEEHNDPVQLFQLPAGWFAQEPRFVPRLDGRDEDDGWLLTYVFDESQLSEKGACGEETRSELWVIDAKGMKEVVARIKLPQRVPYGLHGNWFSEENILNQKPFDSVHRLEAAEDKSVLRAAIRDLLERWLQ